MSSDVFEHVSNVIWPTKQSLSGSIRPLLALLRSSLMFFVTFPDAEKGAQIWHEQGFEFLEGKEAAPVSLGNGFLLLLLMFPIFSSPFFFSQTPCLRWPSNQRTRNLPKIAISPS
jgi:hypothetical protein